jgi:hypothetical protein
MNRILKLAQAAFATTIIASAAVAGSTDDYSASLCQQAVKAQVKLNHDKANVEFSNKELRVTGSGASQVEVAGKGHFKRQDGTTKHFNYRCTVDTAAARVVNASFDKVD